MSHRKRVVPPPGSATHVFGGLTEGENELTVGRPVPPPVELTPAGPRFAVGVPTNEPPQPGGAPAVKPTPQSTMPRTAFLFPGQGAQTVGMAGALCQSLPAAHDLFRRASAVLGYDLLDVVRQRPGRAARTRPTSASRPSSSPASRRSNS